MISMSATRRCRTWAWPRPRSGGPARIFRISFSGELAYEVNVPAGYGEAVWELLMAAGAAFDIVPYGMEAQGQHREGPRRRPRAGWPHDRARSWSRPHARARESLHRPALMARPGLADLQRPALVGLRPIETGARLRGGAHLVEDPQRASGESSLGHVTSVANSPTLGHWIALALVAGGADASTNGCTRSIRSRTKP